MATTTGIVTGALDVNTIVSQLMAVERQPITALTTKQTGINSKISALGLIKSQMSTLQSAVQALQGAGTSSMISFSATSSDSTAISASASSTAAAAVYSLNVTSLAYAQQLIAGGQASSTATIGDGTATTVTFDFGAITGGTLTGGVYSGATFTTNGGGTKSITIDSSNNTLQGIRDAINAAKMGVTATIINDGSPTSPYRLSLSSDKTGASNSLKITTSGGDGSIDTLLGYDPGGLPATQHLNQTVAAKDAAFTVNGVPISKASNIVTDAIQGVSLTLNKETTSPVNVTIASDSSAASSKVSNFVTAYNGLYSAMKNASDYKSGSALAGDATLRSLMTQMRSIASAAVTGSTMSNIYQAGITFSATGTMQLDTAKLSSAMVSDSSGVDNLFNSSTGYATQFAAFAKTALQFGGTFDAKTTSYNQSIQSITTQINNLTARLKTVETSYRTTYSNLNAMLASMKDTSSYLAQSLG